MDRFRCMVVMVILAFLAAASALAEAQASAIDYSAANPLSCSPAPCVLTVIQASQGAHQNLDAPIAVNPLNQNELIVGANDYNCGASGFESLGFYISKDGASQWNEYCPPDLFFDNQEYSPVGKPILGYDANGVAYIGGSYGGLEGFQKSSDGVTWSTPAPAVVRANYYSNYCWMAVDSNGASPYVNSVYISCVLGSAHPLRTQQVVVTHSNDGGATWHQVAVAPPQNISKSQDLNTAMAVGGDGTVYVTWMYCYSAPSECNSGTQGYMVFSKSTDGGNTWTVPNLVAPVALHNLPNSVNGPSNIPSISVDNSNGPHTGNLYVAMYNWTGSFLRVQVVRSTDGGNTWWKPVPVAPGITHDQFSPWISVSPTGLVGVSWLDRRNDPANTDYQAFAGISANGGMNFEPNIQLTNTFSNPTAVPPDYDGAVWDGSNYFLGAWTSLSSGLYAQDFVGGIRLK